MFRLSRPSGFIEVTSETSPQSQETSWSQSRRSTFLKKLGDLQRLDIQERLDIQDQLDSPGDTETPEKSDSEDSFSPTMADKPSITQSDFRQKFLRKLAYNNVWVPQAHRSPKHQAVIIFDWDDTLLCTSWLRSHNYTPDGGPEDDLLRSIASYAKTLLETAIKAGHTYIITNAMSGWVEYSAARWAPELLPVLRKVRVISARDKYEEQFPDEVGQWKIQAFLEVQRHLDATPITNLIALGDADYEMEAARIMGHEFEQGLVKTVKFREEPEPEEHLKQLVLVSENLEKIIWGVRSLKVSLSKK